MSESVEQVQTTEIQEKSPIDRLQSEWPVWQQYSLAIKEAIVTHLKHTTQDPPASGPYTCTTEYIFLDEQTRRTAYGFATILGLETEFNYVGKRRQRGGRRCRFRLTIRTPRGLDLSSQVNLLLAMDADTVERETKSKRKKYNRCLAEHQRRLAEPERVLREKFERWVDDQNCEKCGATNRQSPLECYRGETLLCEDCSVWHSEDPVSWTSFKRYFK